ncbi:MAG: flagellar hook-basal body complex protein FliE [Brevinematia bacterium]
MSEVFRSYDVVIRVTNEKHIAFPGEHRVKNVEQSFGELLLRAIDDVNRKELEAKSLQEMAVVSPEEVNVHEVIIAEEEARLSLLFVKTVIEKGITAWRDLLNLR